MRKKRIMAFGLVALGVGGYLIYRRTQPARQTRVPGRYPPLPPYTENRVRLRHYGPLPPDSPLLVEVPGTRPRATLHVLAARRFMALRAAADAAGFPDVRLRGGYREDTDPNKRGPDGRRSLEAWHAYLIGRYGSVKEGNRWRAWESPHETGLAMDFGNHGLTPVSRTDAAQRREPFYLWLVANAYRFGVSPYKGEAWHWEVRVPRDAWASGEEFTDTYGVMA